MPSAHQAYRAAAAAYPRPISTGSPVCLIHLRRSGLKRCLRPCNRQTETAKSDQVPSHDSLAHRADAMKFAMHLAGMLLALGGVCRTFAQEGDPADPNIPQTVELHVAPAAEPRPALKYR